MSSISFVCVSVVVSALTAGVAFPGVGEAGQPAQEDYGRLKVSLRAERNAFRGQLVGLSRVARRAKIEGHLLRRVDQLFSRWLRSRWGLGMPQSTRPHHGKINCGLFVAVVLRDVGFNLPIWKFNRQASSHAICSLTPRRTRRYFHRTPMRRFLAKVKAMGPGLFLIGLDFHIGFLRYDLKRGLRFIHASYVTHRVENEPAATAIPIVSSKNRMVGKILQPRMLRWWLTRKRIKVLGPR